jgi:hypothetical protein
MLVKLPIPIPLPTTVTLMEPVDAALAIDTLLGPAASMVKAAVKLFSCHPVVNTARRSGHTPVAILATTLVSDCHSVTMATVPPTRERLV